MLSYDLMRIGRVIRSSSVPPTEILKVVSDVASNRARNFLAKVIIVEVDKRNKEACDVAVLPIRECGNWIAGTKSKQVFIPDINQALAFPFIIPSGGNPIHAQGIYPVAAYPLYERHFQNFDAKEDNITEYLSSRLERTIDISLEHDEITKIASSINKALPEIEFEGKKLGLMVLAIFQDDSPYFLIEPEADTDGLLILGNSHLNPGAQIAVNADKLLSNFWLAKFAEGEAGGHKDEGVCTICQKHGAVVSAYNKALYWLPTTWEAPLSFGRDKDLVESIALCTECYSDLTLGASVFSKMSKELDKVLTKEVFAPVASPIGKEYSLKGSIKDVDAIYGSMITLPLSDHILDDEELADEWVYSMSEILGGDTPDIVGRKGTSKTRHLKNITGFEATLPEEWDNEEFRLTLIYFSGDPGKLNIHLRAAISDVLPTTASHLQEICDDLRGKIQEIIDFGYIMLSEKSLARKQRQIGTLPYLLATAYGSPYVWGAMEKALKREPLDKTLFYKNSCSRMNQLGKLLPDSIFNLQQETIDYLAINQFLNLYNSNLANVKGGEESMKTPMELINATWNKPIDELQFETIDELGFAAGQVVQRFGRSYYAGTKKDYIKHRIMTFGTSLTPDVIHHKALGRMEEYTAMLGLGVATDVLQRAALVSMGFVQFEGEIKNNKERFMAAFWAGYSLGKKKKDDEPVSNEEGDS